VERLLEAFDAVNLRQIEAAALRDRRDTKYLLSDTMLGELLAPVARRYRVLQVNGTRLQAYRTLYFDSEDLALYTAHHNRRPGRYKVRSREYLETGETYLEVKRKGKRNRTAKTRTRTRDLVTEITAQERSFLERHDAIPGELTGQLANEFLRAALVGPDARERITIDIGIRLGFAGAQVALEGLAVVEVKEAKAARESPLVERLRAMRIHPTAFSKYCTGIAILRPGAKHNQFKPALRRIESIVTGDLYVS
jgi:hypothetical protein